MTAWILIAFLAGIVAVMLNLLYDSVQRERKDSKCHYEL